MFQRERKKEGEKDQNLEHLKNCRKHNMLQNPIKGIEVDLLKK